MKRVIILALALALLCCACTVQGTVYPSDDVSHEDVDHPYTMDSHPSMLPITDTGDSYCFRVPSLLMVMPKETMEAMPLCAKPNCLHERETDAEKYRLCGAYFEASNARLYTFRHGGSLYVLQSAVQDAGRGETTRTRETALVRVTEDGAKRETVLVLGGELSVTAAILHRGTLYVAAGAYDENMTYQTALTAYSIDRPSEKPRVLYRAEGKDEAITLLTAYGSRVYFKHSSSASHADDTLYALRIGGGEPEPLLADDGVWTASDLLFWRGRMIVFQTCYLPDAPERGTTRVLECALDGSDAAPLPYGDGIYASDGKYLYIGANLWSPDNDGLLHIRDETGAQVGTLDLRTLPGVAEPRTVTYYAGTDGRVLIYAHDAADNREHLLYFDRTSPEAGTPEVRECFDWGKEYAGPR
ncbi:MAG: hypothetical protein MR832_05550 [Clostridiales bacterium]|nr:hypothetical protein [Clostridiales bacterium]